VGRRERPGQLFGPAAAGERESGNRGRRRDANLDRDMANQELELKKRQAQRAADQKKAEKQRVNAALQQQACTEAREQIKIFDANELILARINEKGEPVYLDEAMRAKERERLDVQIRQNCSG
jgi:hypothetical protein